MEFKRMIVILLIAATIIMVCVFGVSYAYYSVSNASTEFNTSVSSEDVSVVYVQSEYISITTGIPITEAEVPTKAGSSKFSALADANTFAGYEVALEVGVADIKLADALKVADFKIQLLENGTVIKTITGADIGSKSSIALKNLSKITLGTTYNYELRVWINETGASQNELMGKSFTGRIYVSSSIKK